MSSAKPPSPEEGALLLICGCLSCRCAVFAAEFKANYEELLGIDFAEFKGYSDKELAICLKGAKVKQEDPRHKAIVAFHIKGPRALLSALTLLLCTCCVQFVQTALSVVCVLSRPCLINIVFVDVSMIRRLLSKAPDAKELPIPRGSVRLDHKARPFINREFELLVFLLHCFEKWLALVQSPGGVDKEKNVFLMLPAAPGNRHDVNDVG